MLTFSAAFIVKLIATILVALVALYAAEHLGPFWGGMIAAFPSTVGPAFIILAIERPPEFVADSALSASASFSAAVALVVAVTLLAARKSHPIVIIGGAWFAWIVFAAPARLLPLTSAAVLIANAIAFAVGILLTLKVVRTPVLLPPFRPRWYDIPLRATVSGLFVTSVTAVGGVLGPQATGIASSFPIILSTLAMILLPRSGAAVIAATFAHTLRPMLLLPAALVVVHMTAVPLGSWLALALGFAICLAWALTLIFWRRRQAAGA